MPQTSFGFGLDHGYNFGIGRTFDESAAETLSFLEIIDLFPSLFELTEETYTRPFPVIPTLREPTKI